jgi:hypothetical protein
VTTRLSIRAQLRTHLCSAVAFLLLASASSLPLSAATLKGTVTNGTNNKPSAGDEVILIKLAAGMEEVGHAKTDAQGKFSFTFADADSPHLVRAIHQGVTYHEPAPPGTDSVAVTVYDVSKKVSGVHAVADLMYLQAAQGKLEVMRLFAVENTSKPPLTQMNDANFEFYMPEGAEIDDAQAQTQGGQGVNVAPAPQAEKGRYAFAFPVRPGQTQFQVAYHLTYTGKATIDPRPIYPLQHFVAILPRSIGFAPAQGGVYEDKQPPDQPDAIAEVASNPRPGEKLAFEISGDGTLKDQDEQASNQVSKPTASNDSRPGGGLGPPIEAPDPLDRYRTWILVGFGTVLVAGAIFIAQRSRSANPAPAASGNSSKLLDGLKDELFQLEVEHKKGQITDQEYTRTKSALDQTLARAIKRRS